MLTAIHFKDHTLHLRTPDSENIFDIDSLSLLIGPNGSGKTYFLRTLIEELVPSRLLSLTKDWRAEFDFEAEDGDRPLQGWGVVYYNPVPHRPKFRARKGFVDASGKTTGNMFELASHSDILQGFGLKARLTATLNANIDELCKLLADGILESDHDQHPTLYPLINHIRVSVQKLSPALTFNIKDEIARLEGEIRSGKDSFYAAFQKETIDHNIKTLGARRTYATFAVLNYLINTRALTKKKAIGYLHAHLEIEPFLAAVAPISQEEKRKQLTLIDNTIALMEALNIKPDQLNGRLFDNITYRLQLEQDRPLFEQRHHPHAFAIDFPGLSSGEHAICNQLIALKAAIRSLSKCPNILVLIDEGDAFLHLAWQRCYVLEVNNFLARCKAELGIANLQLVLASHSPLLTSDVPSAFICRLEAESTSQAQPSFAAPIHAILNLSFGASTIGEFATRRINATIDKLQKKQPLTPTDEYVIASIDDPIIVRELKRLREEPAK